MRHTPRRVQVEASRLKRGSCPQPGKGEDQIAAIRADQRILQRPSSHWLQFEFIGAAATDQRGGLNPNGTVGEADLTIAHPGLALCLQTPLPNGAVQALLQNGLISNSFNDKFHAFIAAAQAQVHGALALSPDHPSTSEPEHHITLSECKAANQRQWNQPGGSRGHAHA
ncbi:hypothetical protein [Synechococcus sp. ROS8604]|uniref:hypothetical protein n=1 Tax=Synechococcus sp. ROS8604 TaxID=1442557 RepID=UPI00351C0CBE